MLTIPDELRIAKIGNPLSSEVKSSNKRPFITLHAFIMTGSRMPGEVAVIMPLATDLFRVSFRTPLRI